MCSIWVAARAYWRLGGRPKALPVQALAVDIDEQAARIAAANAKRNGVAAQVRTAASDGYKSRLVRRHAPYDLVFANILAPPADAHGPNRWPNHLMPGGLAILAGLLTRQERLVLAAHRAQGLALIMRVRSRRLVDPGGRPSPRPKATARIRCAVGEQSPATLCRVGAIR